MFLDMSRNLLFGVSVSTSAAPGADPVAQAQAAERFGFDFVSASDHPAGNRPNFEVWTMLSWIAAATSRITVATKVLGLPYRPPAMVAKMAETFDRLSGGRLILGLGGGYSDDEFRAFGLDVPTAGQKVTGLREGIQIIRGLWAEPCLTFAGSRYRTEDAELDPKPAHRIPIWLGTFGPRALGVTGELADGWIPSLGFAPPEQIPAMRARIDAAAKQAGRDPGEITGAYNVEVRVGGSPQPGIVSGPPGAIIEQLNTFVELGFTAFNFMVDGPEAQLEQLGRDVLPALRTQLP
jgi:alkanesulfonate monooxygenase SsuD/methylene tetrahydromethanopterin reductase-like flavin-dependent oxidoreductase (luciferase family)